MPPFKTSLPVPPCMRALRACLLLACMWSGPTLGGSVYCNGTEVVMVCLIWQVAGDRYPSKALTFQYEKEQ